MNISLHGLENFPKEESDQLVEFITKHLTDETENKELSTFIYESMISEGDDSKLDFMILRESEYFNEQFNNFVGKQTHDVESTSEMATQTSQILESFGDTEQVQHGDFQSLDEDDDIDEVVSSDIEKQNDVTHDKERALLDSFAEDAQFSSEQDVSTVGIHEDDDEVQSNESAPEFDLPVPDNSVTAVSDTSARTDSVDEETKQDVDDKVFSDAELKDEEIRVKVAKLEEENRRLMAIIEQGGGQAVGGHASGESDLLSGAIKMVADGSGALLKGLGVGGGALAAGGGKLAGSLVEGTGKLTDVLVENGIKGAGNILKLSDRFKNSKTAQASMDVLKGKSAALFDSSLRNSLTSESNNVIDLQSKMNQKLLSMNKEEIEERLSKIAGARFDTCQRSILNIINGIDENQLSKIEIEPGLNLKGVVSAAKNGTGLEKTMATTILAGHKSLPDIRTEFDLVSQEYSKLADQINGLSNGIERSGWDSEEIAERIGVPLKAWQENREVEDALLCDLAELTGTDEDMEDLQVKREAMEKMAAVIKQLIDSILGRGQEEEHSTSPSMGN